MLFHFPFTENEKCAHCFTTHATSIVWDWPKDSCPSACCSGLNLEDSPFYGHGASFTDLKSLIEYKNEAIAENSNVTSAHLATAFKPLNLSDDDIDDIVAFLRDGLYDPDLERYVPDFILSGNCFPMNDANSQEDLGCN